jgi:hypothetical protein
MGAGFDEREASVVLDALDGALEPAARVTEWPHEAAATHGKNRAKNRLLTLLHADGIVRRLDQRHRVPASRRVARTEVVAIIARGLVEILAVDVFYAAATIAAAS